MCGTLYCLCVLMSRHTGAAAAEAETIGEQQLKWTLPHKEHQSRGLRCWSAHIGEKRAVTGHGSRCDWEASCKTSKQASYLWMLLFSLYCFFCYFSCYYITNLDGFLRPGWAYLQMGWAYFRDRGFLKIYPTPLWAATLKFITIGVHSRDYGNHLLKFQEQIQR